MIDLRQTKNYSKYMELIGWQVENCRDFFAYHRKIPLLGTFIKVQRPEKISLKHIELISKKLKPYQIIIEPKDGQQAEFIRKIGFKPSKSYFVPSKTVIIDLTKTENQLIKNMHYKTRYNIKRSTSSGMTISLSNNIDEFASYWQDCARRQRGMYLSQKKEISQIFKAFGKDAQIVSVVYKKSVLSAILLIYTKDITYYMYAASTSEGKKMFAPTQNVWGAIRLAKRHKCKFFDFEGIYDERYPIKSWKGFTRFKRSFGGRDVTYPGTFHKFLLPFIS